MIRKVSELIEEILHRESIVMDSETISHGPTIGAMYESHAQKLMRYVLPEGLDLRVVSGFIVGHDGQLSGQQDCMIVIGEGVRLPEIDVYKYPVEQVLMSIQVKKNLTSKQIPIGYENLNTITNLMPASSDFPVWPIESTLFELTGKRISVAHPPDESTEPELAQIFHYLLLEYVTPIKVLLGYHGHKTESGFRRAIWSHCQSMGDMGAGNGPRSLPTLIMNPRFCVIKPSGNPWHTPSRLGQLPILSSLIVESPLYTLLDCLWSRLNHRELINSSVFDGEKALKKCIALVEGKPDVRMRSWSFEHCDMSEREIQKFRAG